MAFLLRLKRILPLTSPSPSLLRHRRLFSTSNNSAGLNSNNPSPSLLSELREAVKKLHADAYIYKSGGPRSSAPSFNINLASSTFSSVPSLKFNPDSYTFSFAPSSEEEQNPNSSSTTLDEKLEQLKLKALSLKLKQETDEKRIWELIESRKALSSEIIDLTILMMENVRRLNIDKPPAHEIDLLIVKLTKSKEMTVEIVELSKDLTNSRLASFHEIVQNLSQIRRKHGNEDFGDELMDGLMRGVRLEVIQFEILAETIDEQLASIENNISNYFHVRDHCTCKGSHICSTRQLLKK